MTNTQLSLPKAVLFDWDNTLINNWPVTHYAINKLLQHYGMSEVSIEDLKNRPGKSARETFPLLFGPQWKEAADYYYKAYQEIHLERLSPLPYAEDALRFLKDKAIPMGIVSNKRGDNLRAEIHHLGWGHYFQAVVGSYDTSHDKPSSVPVHHALNQLDHQAGPHVWFIGDNEVDIATAHHANLTGIFINDFQCFDKLKYTHPLAICFENLKSLIDSLDS